MNRCGACTHHRMTGPLAAHSYGTCAARPDPAMRAGIATSAQAVCRIGLFEAKKQGDVIPGRTNGSGMAQEGL